MSSDDQHVNWTALKGFLSVNEIRFFEGSPSMNRGREAYAPVGDMEQADTLMDLLVKLGVKAYIRTGELSGKPPKVIVDGVDVKKLESNISLTPLPVAVSAVSTLLGAAGRAEGVGVNLPASRPSSTREAG